MFLLRLEPHQVDDVHHAYLQFRQVLAEQRRRGNGLERRDVACTREDDVRHGAVVVRRPAPDSGAVRAVDDRVLHREVVQRGLLPRDDDVDVVPAAQTVIGDRQQAVRIGRKIDADDPRALVDDVVDEAGILMREPVVVLPPHM